MAKLLLETRGVRKAFAEREIIRPLSLSVYDGERIGLVGENGAGKSTLLSLLAGTLEPDGGSVLRHCPVAVIRQQGGAEDAGEAQVRSLFRAPDARGGLSGGEETRRRIAAALSQRAQLLLADEPTTDLDGEGIALLRRELAAFDGALILVSHDRELLRALCGRVLYLEDGAVTDFPGGYDAFTAERERQRERQRFEYDRYREEKARLEASAQRMAERASSVRKAPARMGNSEARLHKREWTDSVLRISHGKRTLENRIERLEVRERPRDLPDVKMTQDRIPAVGAKTVLEFRCASLAAGGRTLLENTGFTLPTGSRTALLGPNGCGKTTLLRALTGSLPEACVFDGSVRLNPAVRIGRFDQHHEQTLRPDRTLLDNLTGGQARAETEARTVLARLGFARQDAFKTVSLLSGGEKAKAALARLLLSDCNLLLLDEPTNALDIFTLEALEALLGQYAGTLLFVSHDAAFVENTATRFVRFGGLRLETFEGTPAREAAERKARESDAERRLAVSTLEMRLAALAARMAKPLRGDRPEELNAQYLELAEALRRLKR